MQAGFEHHAPAEKIIGLSLFKGDCVVRCLVCVAAGELSSCFLRGNAFKFGFIYLNSCASVCVGAWQNLVHGCCLVSSEPIRVVAAKL